MNCLFIYNPVSGRGKIDKKLDRIVRSLSARFDKVDVYRTQCAGDMTQAVGKNAEKYDAIVFSGGDGSFNEAVQGLASARRVPLFGYIPSGTVNDVARSLGIPKSLRGALKVIRTGKSEHIDCMKVNDRLAMYICAAGIFTSVPYTTPQAQKKMIGKLAYAVEGIRKDLFFEPFDVTVSDGTRTETTQTAFVVIVNGRYVAGMPLNGGASMTDGKIECAVIRQRKKPGFWRRIRVILSLAHLFLLGYRVKEKMITRFSGSRIEVHAEEGVRWTYDGECGDAGDITVEVLPGFVNMIVPGKFASSVSRKRDAAKRLK